MATRKSLVIKRSIITIWLVVGLLASVYAIKQVILPFINAKSINSPGVTNLTPPYIRLVRSEIPVNSNQLAIDAKVNTNGLDTIEADIVLGYDPASLSIKENNIKFYNKYAITQISQVDNGIINIGLFSNPQRGEPKFKTSSSEEVVIATFIFDVKEKQQQTDIKIKFQPGKLDESNLILDYITRPATPTDILQNVQGISLSL